MLPPVHRWHSWAGCLGNWCTMQRARLPRAHAAGGPLRRVSAVPSVDLPVQHVPLLDRIQESGVQEREHRQAGRRSPARVCVRQREHKQYGVHAYRGTGFADAEDSTQDEGRRVHQRLRRFEARSLQALWIGLQQVQLLGRGGNGGNACLMCWRCCSFSAAAAAARRHNVSTSPKTRCVDAIRLDVNDVNHDERGKTTDIFFFLLLFDSDTDRKKSYTSRRTYYWRVHTRTVPEHESIAMPL